MRPLTHMMLKGGRHAIDWIDDGMVHLLAGRQRMVDVVGRSKRRAGLAQCDPRREHAVQERARRLAHRCGIAGDSAARLMELLIAEAHRQQSRALPASFLAPSAGPTMSQFFESDTPSRLWRLLPPPRYWRPVVSRLPAPLRQQLAVRLLASALTSPQAMDTLQPILGRRLGIRVEDLDLEWVLELHADGLRLSSQPAETIVSGSATDLLRLASRMEDADTLFFQRKLTLTGDTELGLTLRNLLDRLPWEALPLGQRIVLQQCAQLACRARAGYHGSPSPVA